jgi:hypothetical protein
MAHALFKGMRESGLGYRRRRPRFHAKPAGR